MEISDNDERLLPSRVTITEIYAAATLKNQKNCSHKYGGIFPLGGIATVEMVDAEDLKNIRTKLTGHFWKSIKRKSLLS